jgi:sterol desaturase/sphingolipid hydroxylase (fatty acid hydroxylase superfamily)
MELLNHPYFIAAILLVILLEYSYSKINTLNNYDAYEVVSNFVLISIDKIIAFFTVAGALKIPNLIAKYALFEFHFDNWIRFTLTFIGCEFFYYWNHRYHHYTNLGWSTHIMHHSPVKYNLTLGYRLGVTRTFSLGWVVFLPMMLIGFKPEEVLLCLSIIFVYQFFIHTELVPKLGIIDKYINTPSAHRVHHSSDPLHYNTNLGGITLIFDHLFGTYMAEPEGKMEYGIPELMKKKNIVLEIFVQWRNVFFEVIRARNPKSLFKALFARPGQLKL